MLDLSPGDPVGWREPSDASCVGVVLGEDPDGAVRVRPIPLFSRPAGARVRVFENRERLIPLRELG